MNIYLEELKYINSLNLETTFTFGLIVEIIKNKSDDIMTKIINNSLELKKKYPELICAIDLSGDEDHFRSLETEIGNIKLVPFRRTVYYLRLHPRSFLRSEGAYQNASLCRYDNRSRNRKRKEQKGKSASSESGTYIFPRRTLKTDCLISRSRRFFSLSRYFCTASGRRKRREHRAEAVLCLQCDLCYMQIIFLPLAVLLYSFGVKKILSSSF